MNDSVSVRPKTCRILIPSISSINDFWPESERLIAVPHNLQRSISSPASAIHIGFNLLADLCEPTNQNSRTRMIEQQCPWVSDTCEELWSYFCRWSITSEKAPLHDETIALYMRIFDSLTVSTPGSVDRFPPSVKVVTTSVNSIARLIEGLAASPMSESNQGQLALMVTRLYRTAHTGLCHKTVLDRRRPPCEIPDMEALEQSATRICKDSEAFSTLNKDLQVCTSVQIRTEDFDKGSLHYVFGSRKVNGLRRPKVSGTSYAPTARQASPPTELLKMQPSASKCFRRCTSMKKGPRNEERLYMNHQRTPIYQRTTSSRCY